MPLRPDKHAWGAARCFTILQVFLYFWFGLFPCCSLCFTLSGSDVGLLKKEFEGEDFRAQKSRATFFPTTESCPEKLCDRGTILPFGDVF